MSKAAYSKHVCRCGKVISNAGVARVGHWRWHVRRGEAEEKPRSIYTRDPYKTLRFEWIKAK